MRAFGWFDAWGYVAEDGFGGRYLFVCHVRYFSSCLGDLDEQHEYVGEIVDEGFGR